MIGFILTCIVIILLLVLWRLIKERSLTKFMEIVSDDELKKIEEAADEDLLNNNNIISRRNKDIVATESMYRCMKNHCVDYWLTVKQDDGD